MTKQEMDLHELKYQKRVIVLKQLGIYEALNSLPDNNCNTTTYQQIRAYAKMLGEQEKELEDKIIELETTTIIGE